MPEGLYLHEESLLLALRDHDGKIAMGTQYGFALGGAILAELLLSERVVVEEQKRRMFLKLIDDTPFGDNVLDECLTKVAQAPRRAQLSNWVSRFAHLKQLKNRIGAGLCQKGILKETEDRVLWLFRRKLFPEVNPAPERHVLKRLENAIFGDASSVTPRTTVLLSLMNNSGVLRVNFDPKALKKQKKRIEQIINGDLAGRATKQAIQAMQAAVVVAAVLPSMIAVSS